MPEYNAITYEVERGRARITLNRPEKLNALSFELQTELNQALWDADNDNNVHAVILRGNGRAFSAGYDLTPMSRRRPGEAGPPEAETNDGYTAVYRGRSSFDDDAWQLERAQRLRMAIFDMHKPVIAQVHGYCLAGGTDVALLCDIIIAADDATIGFPPARAMGSLPNQMWVYHCGPQWAKRLTLTGDLTTAINGGTSIIRILSWTSRRVSGWIVDSRNCEGFISPSPLKRVTCTVPLSFSRSMRSSSRRFSSSSSA